MGVGSFLLPGSDRRPADVLIPYWAGGKDAALNVTVVTEAAANTGSALTVAFNRKIVPADDLCRRQGLSFKATISRVLRRVA